MNKVFHRKSAVEGKVPASSGMTYGEIFINYASGQGKSFLSTKKIDDTVAVFPEKDYNDATYGSKSEVSALSSSTLVLSSATSNIKTDVDTLSGSVETLSAAVPTQLSQLSADTTHRLVTDAEKETWNNASASAHSHENKSVLDTITSGKTARWDASISAVTLNGSAVTVSGGSVDLGNFYTKEEIDEDEEVIVTAISNLNDKIDEMAMGETVFSASVVSALDEKVDKVAGKGLSTNDYTTAEKTKLAGIASGAEVNVQSNWDEADSGSDAFILNKPDLSGYFDGAEYVSTGTSAHTILFKNNNTVVASIDATDFIKDGMVSDAYVSGTNLVIVFNADAGKENVLIPISDIFNANNYYTKTEIDVSAHTHTNLAVLEAITSNKVSNWDDAYSSAHSHTNKSLLDTYTQTEADLASAVTYTHDHSNKSLLDTYTQTEADLASAVANTHNHTNKSVIDGIAAADVTRWNNSISAITVNGSAATVSGGSVELSGFFYTKAELDESEEVLVSAVNDLRGDIDALESASTSYLTGITRAQVEAVLTGNVTSHVHNQYASAVTINGSAATVSGGSIDLSPYFYTKSEIDDTEEVIASALNDLQSSVQALESASTSYLTGITKAQVENVLTGDITTHIHSQYVSAVTVGSSAFTVSGGSVDLSPYFYTKSEIDDTEEIIATAISTLDGRVGTLETNVGTISGNTVVLETNLGIVSANTVGLAEEVDNTERVVAGALNNLDLRVTGIEGNYATKDDALDMESITWSTLKTKRDGGTLVPGRWYRITDYNTTTSKSDTQSAGHQFDVVVLALDENTLSEEARALKHSGDTYFTSASATVEGWKVWYCLDNDTNRFDWAYSTNGKGVIYRMIDEFRNDCPYDFKNIMFKTGVTSAGTVTDVFYYTFSIASGTNDATVTDFSLNGARCYGNKMGVRVISNKQKLSFNVFRNTSSSSSCHSNTFGVGCYFNTFGNSCFYNTFGNDCYDNTFERSCSDNTFGDSCYSNTFERSCSGNTFGNSCFYNTFGRNCSDNTFGNSCSNNTFGRNCNTNTFGSICRSNTFGDYYRSNTFGNSCSYNTFGNSCYNNTFGNYCNSNTFGNYCNYNTFGEGCESNMFGNSCSYNTFGDGVSNFIFGNTSGATTSAYTKDYVRNVIVENGVQNVNAYCTGSTSDSNYCQNIRICLGVKGTDGSNRKQIDITSCIGSTVNNVYQPAGSNTTSV